MSPSGGSDGDGSKDAPFGSLEAVRDYLRENRSTELPTTVYLRGGTYVLNKTFELTAEDGGGGRTARDVARLSGRDGHHYRQRRSLFVCL